MWRKIKLNQNRIYQQSYKSFFFILDKIEKGKLVEWTESNLKNKTKNKLFQLNEVKICRGTFLFLAYFGSICGRRKAFDVQ